MGKVGGRTNYRIVRCTHNFLCELCSSGRSVAKGCRRSALRPQKYLRHPKLFSISANLDYLHDKTFLDFTDFTFMIFCAVLNLSVKWRLHCA